MRFDEFDYGWLFKTIKDVSDVVGGGTPETDKEEYWNGNIQWFTPSEIGLTKYVSKSQRTITELGLNKSSAKLLPQGTLLLSTRATVGECSIAMNECTTNQGFQSLIPKKIVDRDFLYYLIQTKKHHLVKHACGSTFLEISNSEIKNLSVAIPHEKEQRKLGHFLSLIDERIYTQSKIIEKLQSQMNWISQRYFNNLKSPSIELSNIADIYQPETIAQSKCTSSGAYKVFGANGIIGRYNKYNHELEQVCITCRGSTSGNVFLTDKYSWITGNAMVINIDKFSHIINKTFLYYYLSCQNFKNIISGSGQPQIVRSPLLKFKIKLPNINEQNKFERDIRQIASKLQIEKDILSLYKKQKAYLLRNMFI